jgi:hypothetical protein
VSGGPESVSCAACTGHLARGPRVATGWDDRHDRNRTGPSVRYELAGTLFVAPHHHRIPSSEPLGIGGTRSIAPGFNRRGDTPSYLRRTGSPRSSPLATNRSIATVSSGGTPARRTRWPARIGHKRSTSFMRHAVMGLE